MFSSILSIRISFAQRRKCVIARIFYAFFLFFLSKNIRVAKNRTNETAEKIDSLCGILDSDRIERKAENEIDITKKIKSFFVMTVIV